MWCEVAARGEEKKEAGEGGAEAAAMMVRCGGEVFRQAAERRSESPSSEEEEDRPLSAAWWGDCAGALVCMACAGLAAGLTLGMASLDEFALRVLCNRSPDDVDPDADAEARQRSQTKLLQDQDYAMKILPLLSGHFNIHTSCSRMSPSNSHCLLVTLLLINASANEALPLFLDKVLPGWLAVLVSVSVVLVFGEIVPSALFTGPDQLRFAAFFAPLVRVARWLFLPVVWPIGLMLDRCLGHGEGGDHGRAELKATARTLQSQGLEREEVNMIVGVLEMTHKVAGDVAKPLGEAKMLAHDDVIDAETVQNLLAWGHSRVFVFCRDPSEPSRRDDIVGVLLVRKLLGLHPEERPRVDSLQQAMRQPLVLSPADSLLSIFHRFQAGHCHLAVVRQGGGRHGSSAPPPQQEEEAAEGGGCGGEGGEAEAEAEASDRSSSVGFCSFEDVIEAMLKEDILDEEDVEKPAQTAPLRRMNTAASAIVLRMATKRSWQ